MKDFFFIPSSVTKLEQSLAIFKDTSEMDIYQLNLINISVKIKLCNYLYLEDIKYLNNKISIYIVLSFVFCICSCN